MKPKLQALVSLSVGLIGWLLGARWEQSGQPQFDGQSLSNLARHLTAQPIGRESVLAQAGPILVPYLIQEIKTLGWSETDLSYRVVCWTYATLPHQLRRFMPTPVLQNERRLNALLLLGKMGPDAKAAVPVLIRLLDSEELRQSAITTLVAIGPAAKQAVPRLLKLLEQEHCPSVCLALSDLGADPVEVVPVLIRVQTNGPPWLRIEASVALRRLIKNRPGSRQGQPLNSITSSETSSN